MTSQIRDNHIGLRFESEGGLPHVRRSLVRVNQFGVAYGGLAWRSDD